MKKLTVNLFLIAVILLGFYSCSRKTTPAILSGKGGKSFDEAAFNFVYVEAIKQKLIGNGGEALKYLEQCAGINPESDAVYYQMAQILVAGGDLKNGKKFVQKAIAVNDKNLWYLMMVAGIYYQEKNIDSAIIYYEKAVRTFPENDKLQLTLGNLYSENKSFDKAISVFGNIDSKYGVNDASTISAIKNLMSAGKYNEALEKAKQLLEKKPDELLYNGLLAEIYRGMGDKEKAIGVYNSLIERNPENAATQLSVCDFLITEKIYDDLFVFLRTVIINSKVVREEKIALLARIIELPDLTPEHKMSLGFSLMVLESSFKDDDVIPLLRVELLIGQEKLAEAAVRLEEIVKIKPSNYYAWEKLLLVYLQLNDFQKLTTKAEVCASMFNMSFLAKILYATGATETKKYEVALEELRKAEILAGNNNDELIQVLTIRADVYYRMKDFVKSFEIFDQAIKANPDDMTLLNNYAYYLAEQNMRLKEAAVMAKKVIEREKNNTTFLDTYGWVLYKQGKLKDAAKVMESIINSGEKPDAEWYEHYGFVLKGQRKCKEAILNWNVSIKLDSTKTNLAKEIESCTK